MEEINKNNLDKILKKLTVQEKEKLIQKLSQFVTQSRFEKIVNNSKNRTRYATAVLEDISKSHNISAVLRSSECFGFQDIHIIEQQYNYDISPGVAKGATQWLDLYNYNNPEVNNTEVCFENLRNNGYKIYATTPHTKDQLIYDLPLDNKVALVFGTEIKGISNYAMKNVDGFVKIPMYGFTESLNISVSVAISLYDLSRRLRSSNYNWRLSQEQILDLQISWLGKTTGKLWALI